MYGNLFRIVTECVIVCRTLCAAVLTQAEADGLIKDVRLASYSYTRFSRTEIQAWPDAQREAFKEKLRLLRLPYTEYLRRFAL